MAFEITQRDKELFDQVTEWARHAGWSVSTGIAYEDQHEDSSNGRDRHGLVLATRKGGKIQLEPSGRQKDGTDIVDVLAWPTLIRVRLYHREGAPDWTMVTDAGIPFGYAWNRDNFLRLARDLIAE